jgi:hypothetical protein
MWKPLKRRAKEGEKIPSPAIKHPSEIMVLVGIQMRHPDKNERF